MFRLRDMRPNSPFRERVGFIEGWFMNEMQNHFNNRDPKAPELPFDADYFDHFNGKQPENSATEKRWWYDIDNLYGAVNMDDDHWVAVDINFPEEKIYVYDSGKNSDKKIGEQLMFLRRMMPHIVDRMLAVNEQRKSNKDMFELIIVKKDVPTMKTPGDCGVYALKYIECLALGLNFKGLHDRSMNKIRRRLAAELFDEIPDIREEAEVRMSNPLPRRSEPYCAMKDNATQ